MPTKKKAEFRTGQEIWLDCDTRSGPFDDELRVYVRIGEQEWFGFVDSSDIKEIKEGKKIRAKIVATSKDAIIVGIPGVSPNSRSIIKTTTETIKRLNPIAA